MTNEAIAVQVPLGVYMELAYRLRNSGDTREPDDVVVFALKAWLGKQAGTDRAAAINGKNCSCQTVQNFACATAAPTTTPGSMATS